MGAGNLFPLLAAVDKVGKRGIVLNTGRQKGQTLSDETAFRLSGLVLIIASGLYLVYCVQMLRGETAFRVYPTKWIPIGIATVSFVEIGMAIRGLVKARKTKTLMMEALKFIALSSALVSLVLTQSALLSLGSQDGQKIHTAAQIASDITISASCGLLGLIVGGLSALMGVYMLFRYNKQKGKRKT
jgi:hypothetical protein